MYSCSRQQLALVVNWFLVFSSCAILAGAGDWNVTQTPAICDVASAQGTPCAEWWSCAQSASASYHGPLCQIALFATPSTTMDITQTSTGSANLTGVLNFCGGTYSNCAITKIYAQIHGHTNDLLPINFFPPHLSSCDYTSKSLACACPLAIDSASGLPIVQLDTGGVLHGCEYTLTNDNPATGITGGTSNTSLLAVGQTVVPTAGLCCGPFMIAHRYDAYDTPGTDFGMTVAYGTAGEPYLSCGTNNVCLSVDTEGTTPYPVPIGPDLGTSPLYIAYSVGYAAAINVLTAYANGHQQWSPFVSSVVVNPDARVHAGGGGDLSQPAPFNLLEGGFFNYTLSAAQMQTLEANVSSRYPSITFP